jgi:hypothetical protein
MKVEALGFPGLTWPAGATCWHFRFTVRGKRRSKATGVQGRSKTVTGRPKTSRV